MSREIRLDAMLLGFACPECHRTPLFCEALDRCACKVCRVFENEAAREGISSFAEISGLVKVNVWVWRVGPELVPSC